MDKILGLGGVCSIMLLFFSPWTYQGRLGSFSALCLPKWGNSKTAHRRAKWTIIWASGVQNCSMHVGIFDLEHVKVIWGHPVQFSENWAVTQKWLIIEHNRWKFEPRGCMENACWYFWPWTCQSDLSSFSAGTTTRAPSPMVLLLALLDCVNRACRGAGVRYPSVKHVFSETVKEINAKFCGKVAIHIISRNIFLF